MEPVAILFLVVSGSAGVMLVVSAVLARKVKLLRKSQTVDDRVKKTQLSDLEGRATSLQATLSKTERDLVRAQNEINELKDREAVVNTELRQLKEFVGTVTKERDRLNKENVAQQQILSQRQKELEDLTTHDSELQGSLREKDLHIQRLQETNQDIEKKIQELESILRKLNEEKEGFQKAISGYEQEVGQTKTQLSELQRTLKEEQNDLYRFENANLALAARIQELQSLFEGLNLEKKSHQETITHQQKELKQILSENSEIKKMLREKEREIQNLQETLKEFQDNNQRMSGEIKEYESRLKALNQENEIEKTTVSDQRKELEELFAQRSEFQDTIREKGRQIQSLEESNKDMGKKLKELEANLNKLNREKQENQKTISSQQQELTETKTRKSEVLSLQDGLKEKEQLTKTLLDANNTLSEDLKKAQSFIQELEKETHTQKVITSELKKEIESFKSKEEEKKPVKDEKRQLDRTRRANEEKIGTLLVDNKFITKAVLQRALDFKNKHDGNLLRFLFIGKEIDESHLAELFSSEFKIPYLPLGSYEVSHEVLDLVPIKIIQDCWVLPVDKTENHLIVAMVDPFDVETIDKIEKASGYEVQTYVGLFSEIAKKIQDFYKINIRGLDTEGNSVSPLFIKTSAYKGRERRSAVRFNTDIEMKVISDSRVSASKIENISWNGLSFKLDYELPVFSTVNIQFNLPDSRDKHATQLPTVAMAQVIRSSSAGNNKFMVGVKLVKILKDDLETVIRFVSGEKDDREVKVQTTRK